MGQPTISFGGTNFVARELGFHRGNWQDAGRATSAYFSPLETFAERFEQFLFDIRALGFESLDLWIAQLDGAWATDAHLAIASKLLKRHRMPVGMVMGGYNTREELENACKVAAGIDAVSVGGIVSLYQRDPDAVVATAKDYGVRVSLENHGESPEQILEQIQAASEAGVVCTTIDTGWCSAYGFDPLHAIDVLEGHIISVHLKDVPRVDARKSCFWGEGIVPIQEVIARLKSIEYGGWYLVDHEPFGYDPSDQCRRMLAMAREWLEEEE